MARTLYTINDKGNQDAIYIKFGNAEAIKFEKSSINNGQGTYNEKAYKTGAQVSTFYNQVLKEVNSNPSFKVRISTKAI